MLKKIAITASLFISCAGMLLGQSSRSLPVLELNADTRTAGMGDANMGETKSMYLYTNPTAFFHNEGNLYTSYTLGMYPKHNDSYRMYHAVSAGYKLFDRHALMVGFRYLDGLKSLGAGDDGIERKPIHPMDWSMDFAYAFQFTPNFSAYAGGNIIQSYNGKTGYTGSFSAGLYYRDNLSLSDKDGSYAVGVSLYDLGGKIKHGKKGTENDLPTSIGAGGSFSLPLNENHAINAALSTRYFLMPTEAKAFTGGIGLEYEMFKMAALRTGYHWGNDNGYFTLGLGCNVKFVRIDAAYLFAKEKDYNFFRLGMSVQF